MTVSVKICGLTDMVNLTAAIEAGADYVGFVFFPKSPRNIDLSQAAELAGHSKSRVQSVALMVNPPDQEILEIVSEVEPDWLQLHGSESPQRVEEIKKLAEKPIMKAIGVASETDVQTALEYLEVTDKLLFDAKPTDQPLPGGNGIAFDWKLLKSIRDRVDFILSGGLTVNNVQAAIELTQATMVDVSSGVESTPGKKDPELIKKFITAAKSA